MTISEALKLAQASIDRIDAQYLLARLLNVSRASLIAHAERELGENEKNIYIAQVEQRKAGTPVAYLIGTREFYGRDFRVTPATLIPRPETELLVEQALAGLSSQKRPGGRPSASVLDQGTGSGAIAISIALAGNFSVTATDISVDALNVARENALNLGANIELVESNWFSALPMRKFDLVVSNPPYIAAGDRHLTQGDLRAEPAAALTDGSRDGLESIRIIIDGAREHLHANGWLMLEHGYDQAKAVREQLLKAGYENLICHRDLAGIERVSAGQIR
ncbi:MAG: peptide chain release factor N(5)-glutamine methyltransferase [Betaproteobacteria bacterium]